MQQKGFTLIELLVVIAIVAILATVVILTLNPAELLRQARDSNRISDLNTLNNALGLYLADVTTPTLAIYTSCYISATSSISSCGFSTTYTGVVASTSRAVNGTGWIPVNFTSISSGSPIGNLPVDPVNTSPNIYRYAASSTLVFELNADLESAKYTDATTGKEVTDGGNNSTLYEVGTAPGLAL